MLISEDRIRAMRFEHPRAIPVGVGFLSATWMTHRQGLADLVARHPLVFPDGGRSPEDFDRVAGTHVAGTHVDEWGCVWTNIHHGMEAMVTGHPLPTRGHVRTLVPPASVTGAHPHGFLWLRLCDLRGFEELMIDFAEEPPELAMLIDAVLAHNLRNLDARLPREAPPLIRFGDDLGMQKALPISPARWRKYIKPCYAEIYGRCRRAGLEVYMHSDGCIHEVIGDLVECGVSVINPQHRANGLDNLVRTCKGRVCVDLDLDRQMMPFATPAQIDRHIRECVEALGAPEGGLWLKAECGPDVPLEIIEAICTAFEKYRTLFTG